MLDSQRRYSTGRPGLGVNVIKSSDVNDKDAVQVLGRLGELDFFGESALLPSSEDKVRKATITAGLLTGCQLLSMTSSCFEDLMASGVLGEEVMEAVAEIGAKRQQLNEEKATADVAVEAAKQEKQAKRDEVVSKEESEVETPRFLKCILCSRYRDVTRTFTSQQVQDLANGNFKCDMIGLKCHRGVML